MRSRIPATGIVKTCVFAFVLFVTATVARAATLNVPAGGDLQAALNAARPGDVITLQPGATYVGNFVLPNKGAISDYITIRSAAPDSVSLPLPPSSVLTAPLPKSQLASVLPVPLIALTPVSVRYSTLDPSV